MKRRLIIEHSREDHRAWLYSVVFSGKVPIVAVFLLFASFLIQPFHQAMAAEEGEIGPEVEETVADSVKEQAEEAEITEIEKEGDEEDVEPEEEVTDDDTTQGEDVEESVEEDSAEDEAASEDESEANQDEVADDESDVTASSTDETVSDDESESATSTDEAVDESDNEGEETASSTDEVDDSTSPDDESNNSSSGGGSVSSDDEEEGTEVEDEAADEDSEPSDNEEESDANDDSNQEISTSTEGTTDSTPVVEAEIIINEDNFYQFSRQSCVAVGDGTYHCSSNDVEEYDNQSVVFSELGESGNLEIFLETSSGDIRQITDNEFDDAAPYYDAETLQIVWQRLIDGRYQIIMYDIAEDEESQLTFSRTNNMEPKVSVDGVVWQAWDNHDWEIMYFDGRCTDQITDNNIQDVTPVIQDRYILWTVIGRSEQEGKVYSLDSQELLTISGYDGGVIENPRFVLVYDTKFDNGDVITQGFDPATGISEPIAAKPAPEPIDIPTPDQIGEIRALIQNKSTFEDDLENQLIHTDNTGSTPTATSSDTLDLKGDESGVDEVATSTLSGDEVFELTEFDLILTETEVNFEELDEIEEIIMDETDVEVPSSTQQ